MLGRAALQKRIMALLRKIETCTVGVCQAWDDTFMNWDGSTKHLSQYPKTKVSVMLITKNLYNLALRIFFYLKKICMFLPCTRRSRYRR
jgi:hypothetical protein